MQRICFLLSHLYYFMGITFSHFVVQFFLVHQSCKPNLSAAAGVLKPPKHKFATLHICQMNSFLTQLELKKSNVLLF